MEPACQDILLRRWLSSLLLQLSLRLAFAATSAFVRRIHEWIQS